MLLWTMSATFGTYACMYGLRKPFTAASFGATSDKAWFVTAQVLGYTLSKVLGIRVIAEASARNRVKTLLFALGMAEVMLLVFAFAPLPLAGACLFLNGLSLGLVFGLVLGFVEGRQLTEVFIAGLCASFILADGASKFVGAALLEHGIPERWMPVTAGALCLTPLLGFVQMLRAVPAPNDLDRAERSERGPMDGATRLAVLRQIGRPLAGVVVAYTLITVLRSLRADFAPEIFKALGAKPDASVFARSELLVALAVCGVNGSLVLIRDNRRAVFVGLALCLAGLFVAAVSFRALRGQWLSPVALVVLSGVGLYVPYVAVHTTLLERMLALSCSRGNLGFLMYVADAAGYLGYMVLMVAGCGFRPGRDFLENYQTVSLLLSVGSMLAVLVSSVDVLRRPFAGPATVARD
jgi:hypothetical protein